MLSPKKEDSKNPFPIEAAGPVNIYGDLKKQILDKKCRCKDPLSDESSYCVTCRKSTCPECDLDAHKDHKVILKKEIYYPSEDIVEIFNHRIDHKQFIEDFKTNGLKNLNEIYTKAKADLDKLYNDKKEEIQKIYDFSMKNMDRTKENLEKTGKSLREFDEENKEFFALNEGNEDQGNHVLLMKLELLDHCQHANMKSENEIEYLTKSLNDYLEANKTKFTKLRECQDDLFGDQYTTFCAENAIQNYYEPVNSRLEVYADMIKNIREKIAKGYNNIGNHGRLVEMNKKLESKDKKGIDVIYNQTIQTEENSKEGSPSSKHLNFTASKSGICSPGAKGIKSYPGQFKAERDEANRANTIEPGAQPPQKSTNNASSGVKKSLSPQFSSDGKAVDTSKSIQTARSSASKKFPIIFPKEIPQINKEQVALKNIIVQKFFTYVLIDTYNKYFSNKGKRASFDVHTRIYSKFQERLNDLKEKAKPIAGSNEILCYNEATQSMQKVAVPLQRDVHGYTAFPYGARHICVDQKLYIIGGTDDFGKSSGICNIFDLGSKEIKRNKDCIYPHAYHSVEYINNFDCIVIVGGENNKTCEMYDLAKGEWVGLPDLNIARANISLYFNEKTNILYAFFGMTGPMSGTKKSYSEILEILDFDDMNSGWLRVDYYKKAMIDLSSNYVSAFPFTLDRLIIRGTKNARAGSGFVGIYDMMKNELSLASENTVKEIQTEEMNIKNYSKCCMKKEPPK